MAGGDDRKKDKEKKGRDEKKEKKEKKDKDEKKKDKSAETKEGEKKERPESARPQSAKPQPRRPPTQKAEPKKGGGSYMEDLDLPSSGSEDERDPEDIRGGKQEEGSLQIQVGPPPSFTFPSPADWGVRPPPSPLGLCQGCKEGQGQRAQACRGRGPSKGGCPSRRRRLRRLLSGPGRDCRPDGQCL